MEPHEMQNEKTQQPIFVSVREGEKAINLGHTKFYELIKTGRIKTVKIGTRTLVVYSSLMELTNE